jgi:aspartate/methionine/tyrosine aminotransferase
MTPLSKLEGSPSLEVVNLVLDKISKGEKVLSLAIGDPSSDTPREIIEAANKSMLSGQVHYVPSSGTREVREAIRNKVRRSNGIRAEIDETLFLTTKLSVYVSLVAIAEPNFEVLVPDPGYFYREPVMLAGGIAKRYRLNEDFSLDIDDIKRNVNEKTRAVVINSPSNPAGKVLTKSDLLELYGLCEERGLYIISDDAYEDLTYDGIRHTAIGSLEVIPERVISLFSLSKSYSMTGWRAGYLVGPKKIVHLMNRFLENTLTCLPPFIQAASAYALNNGEDFIREFRAEYAEKRKVLLSRIAAIPDLECNTIEGAFYAFPKLKDTSRSSASFTKELLEKENVAVLPGSAFGPAGEGRIRISFSGKIEELQAGLEKINGFLARNE